MAFLEEYKAHVAQREALGVPALALSTTQTADLIELNQGIGYYLY